jgi:hypothetical protein
MIPGSALMLLALLVNTESLEWTLNIVGFVLMIAIPFLFRAPSKAWCFLPGASPGRERDQDDLS